MAGLDFDHKPATGLKRKRIIVIAEVLLLGAVLAAYWQATRPAAAPVPVGRIAYPQAPRQNITSVTVTFLHYTNDALGIRSNLYNLANDTEKSMAVLQITDKSTSTNRPPAISVLWDPVSIESNLPRIWGRAEGWYVHEDFEMMKPAVVQAVRTSGNTTRITLPVPAGTNAFRYTLHVYEHPNLPEWRWKAITLLDKANVHRYRPQEYIITSPEITR